jgi:hypothetical protein
MPDSTSSAVQMLRRRLSGAVALPWMKTMVLQGGQISVEVADGLDAAEIILEGDVLIRCVSVFIGEAETDQDAGNFESVVHLSDKGDGAAFTDECGFLAEALFQSRLSLEENGGVVGSHPGFSSAQDVKFAVNGFWEQLSNVFFDEFGNLVRLLIRNETRRKFGKSL